MAQRTCRLGVAALVASLACLAFASSALANFHLMLVREVKPSSSNVANDGYVELQMYQAGQNLVLGHVVKIYNTAGTATETYVMDNNVDNGDLNSTVLIGEQNVPGGVDFTDNNLNIPATGGAACFEDSAPPDCVSWGNFNQIMADPLLPTSAGTPASTLGVTAGKALQRDITANCVHLLESGDDTNDSAADFDEVTPNPRRNSVPPTESDCPPPMPPDTVIDTSPDSTPPFAVSSTSANFTFHASPAAGATLSCKLDNNAPEACNGGSKGYTSLSEASHTFQVTATNADGPDPTPASYTWTVDTTPPDTSITGGPTQGSTVNTTTANFGFSSPNGGTSFQCNLDNASGGAFTPCPQTNPTYSGLGDASHTLLTRAVDDAGNVDDTPASRTWTVDTAPPDTSINGGPANNSFTQATTANFTFSSPDGGITFECKLDAAAGFTTCPGTNPTYSGLSESSHTLQVRAIDAAGNPDASPATRAWTVDQTDPDTLVDTQPSNPTASTSADFTFHATQANSTFQCQLDANAPEACNSGSKGYTGLSQASHTFTVTATDPAGNVDDTAASYTWTVNSAAPPETAIDTTPDSTPPFLVSSTSAHFTFHATPASGATFTCRLDNAIGGFTACPGTNPMYTGLSDGQHTFEVRATGPGGTDATPASYTWTVDTAPPNTTIDANSKPSNPTSSTGASFTFQSTEGSSTFQCRLDSSLPGDFTSCTSPKNLSSLGEGSHTFEVRATDPVGNTDQTPDSYMWTVDSMPPDTMITGGPAEGSTTQSTTANFGFSSPDGGTSFLCKLDSAVVFTTCPVTNPTYSGLGLGPHSLQAKAVDAVGNQDASPATRNWTIEAPPAPPNTVITKAPKKKSKDKTPTTSFVSEPADGATFQCQIDSTAAKACTSPYTSKKLKPGKHTIKVTATRAGVPDPTPASASFKILR